MTSPSDHSAIVDLLCQSWHADLYDGDILRLYPDGTGEIISRADLSLWLAAHINWKIIESGGVQETPAPKQSLLNKWILSCQASRVLVATIEITITKRREPLSHLIINPDFAHTIGGHLLLESAFKPKQFDITVERGEFMAPLKWKGMSSPVFGLRITFDKSPYPPMESWIPEEAPMLESMRQFEKTCFVAQRLEDTKRWGGCITM
ncbi:hypothetical protein BDZ97DRAFT_1703198 [Flammula alnicola]|nr:hypothetical protein BDZ97DRAFT_1703198 [Flammula alnicola]